MLVVVVVDENEDEILEGRGGILLVLGMREVVVIAAVGLGLFLVAKSNLSSYAPMTQSFSSS